MEPVPRSGSVAGLVFAAAPLIPRVEKPRGADEASASEPRGSRARWSTKRAQGEPPGKPCPVVDQASASERVETRQRRAWRPGPTRSPAARQRPPANHQDRLNRWVHRPWRVQPPIYPASAERTAARPGHEGKTARDTPQMVKPLCSGRGGVEYGAMKLTRLATLPLVSLLVLTGCAPKEEPARPLTSATATPTPTSGREQQGTCRPRWPTGYRALRGRRPEGQQANRNRSRTANRWTPRSP